MNSRATRAQTGARQPDLEPVLDNFFVTDPDSTRALLRVEAFPGVIWEPACGNGTMAEVLARGDGVTRVMATDLVDRGYESVSHLQNFLTCPAVAGVDHIITNPPFDLAEEFVLKAIRLRIPGKIAIFLRLAFLEGKRRRETIFEPFPPARVWVFSSRQRLRRGGGEWQSGLIAFCWVIWDRDWVGEPLLGWLP